MKKSDLKELIKECVREVVFEEGALSKIVAEVAQGFAQSTLIVEQNPQKPIRKTNSKIKERIMREIAPKPEIAPTMAEKGLRNMPFFAGTQPLEENKRIDSITSTTIDEAGLDISNIPGISKWRNIVSDMEKGR